MNKADKAFFKEALQELKRDLEGQMRSLKTDLEGQIQGVSQDLKAEIRDIKQGLQAEIHDVKQGLQAEIHDVKQGLQAEIRDVKTELHHQGIMLERVQDDVRILAEGQAALSDRFGRLETDVAEMKQSVCLIPALVDVVQDHGRRLTILER